MTLSDLCTIHEIATELGSTHNQAWRFARNVLREGVRLGNQRLYSRAHAAPAIAAHRRRSA
jgi:hypothetical protein